MFSSFHRCVVALVMLAGAALPATAFALPDFTDLVKDEYRSVVNISTSREVDPRQGNLPPGYDIPEFEDSPFGELFRKFFGEDAVPRYRDTASLGSGFIISGDGYVLTNGHVVSDADKVIVRLHDRRQFEAEVIGIDERSDIALLKVNADVDLPAVEFGDPGALEVGEWVLAIGSPFGFDYSVTAGIVSAKGRSLPNDNYVPFIQTDVAINPGNSGGPLFNMNGEVIGINAQIFSRTGGFMGLSFAIPIDVARDVADQLRTRGKVVRGWLGVVIQEVTHELASSFDMERAYGALVASVLADSPAARAGIRAGDVIIEFNEREVPSSSALPPMVGRTGVDEVARVTVIRGRLRQWRAGRARHRSGPRACQSPADAGGAGRCRDARAPGGRRRGRDGHEAWQRPRGARRPAPGRCAADAELASHPGREGLSQARGRGRVGAHARAARAARRRSAIHRRSVAGRGMTRDRLELLTRADCHLCSRMLAEARPIAERHGVTIETVDIDDDPAGIREGENLMLDRAAKIEHEARPVPIRGGPQAGDLRRRGARDRRRRAPRRRRRTPSPRRR